jgi:uncharacterized protein YaaN involved in tellurite resistance
MILLILTIRSKIKKLNEKIESQKKEILSLKKSNLTWETKFNSLKETHAEFKKEVPLTKGVRREYEDQIISGTKRKRKATTH